MDAIGFLIHLPQLFVTVDAHYPGIISLFALVAIGNIVFHFWKDQLPFLINAQLKFHQLLSYLNPRTLRVKWVTLIEIDDHTFWNPPYSGTQPLNRRALGDLIRQLAEGGAEVIALDVQLKSPTNEPGDDPLRAEQNRYLFESIKQATDSRIPVVLTQGLVQKGNKWKEEPNIFDHQSLPPGAAIGYINLPIDKREIPLRQRAIPWNGTGTVWCDSFAFQIVNQYESTTHRKVTTFENPIIATAIANNSFVYGSFVAKHAFTTISASDLLKDDNKRNDWRGRIVIIGGTWHQSGTPI